MRSLSLKGELPPLNTTVHICCQHFPAGKPCVQRAVSANGAVLLSDLTQIWLPWVSTALTETLLMLFSACTGLSANGFPGVPAVSL